jgi:hypothetical protein
MAKRFKCDKCSAQFPADGSENALDVSEAWCPNEHGLMSPVVDAGEQVCNDCGETKPSTEFYKGKKNCKACYKARYG